MAYLVGYKTYSQSAPSARGGVGVAAHVLLEGRKFFSPQEKNHNAGSVFTEGEKKILGPIGEPFRCK